uniref:Uncharacterized protein n=1 Tax=Meloidogyne enterolobii TaxID=390850 RepID=A0A6V7W2W7_MELEN|nr:unnamed protein product [Meloidogyne enterolobii]
MLVLLLFKLIIRIISHIYVDMAYKNTEVTWKSQQFSVKLANFNLRHFRFLILYRSVRSIFRF